MTLPAKLPVPERSRWQLLRAGIQNVWEYDDQRFVFHKGRLLLRGLNESGKTKALEVLLPFLLDASLHPRRLDPFGSDARSMGWNLLNEANADVNVCIGYVWLEFGRLEEAVPRYWTVGAGLKARRTPAKVDDWYFATSLRVDEELFLLADNRVPLTRPALETAIGQQGTIFENATAYRRALNAQLFGLSQEQYAALVDALLQLRRPQLSKALDPIELSRILSASLPPLDAGVVGSLAEGFDRLDRHRQEREECLRTLESVRAFLEVYAQYAGTVAKGRAGELTRADSAYHASRAKWREADVQHHAALAELDELVAALEALETEDLKLEARLAALRNSDAFRAVARLSEAEVQAKRMAEAAQRAATSLEQVRVRLRRAKEDLNSAERLAGEDARALERETKAALAAAETCGLVEAHGAVLTAHEQGKAAADALDATLRLRNEAIAALRQLSRELANAVAALDAATARAAQAEQRARAAREALQEAEAAERTARAQFIEAVEGWANTCTELGVDLAMLVELPPEEMRASLDAPAAERRSVLDADLVRATLAHERAAEQHQKAVGERERLLTQEYQPPVAPVWRSPRSEGLRGAPFYGLCDFAEGVTEQERAGLEAALQAAGLLDAWVTPDGSLLDPRTFDTLLVPTTQQEGPSLADVLMPTPDGPVGEPHILRVLRSIGLGEGTAAAWVTTDGRFALGPLRGAFGKTQAAFIGAAARERARERQLAELATLIARLDVEVRNCEAAVAALRRRIDLLGAEVRSFPDLRAVREALFRVKALSEQLSTENAAHLEELEGVRKADNARSAAAKALDARAEREALRGWVDRLDDLANHTASYGAAARALLKTAEVARRSADQARSRRSQLEDVEKELTLAAGAGREARDQATEAQAHAEALRETVGHTRDEVLSTIRVAQERQQHVRDTLKSKREARAGLDGQIGVLSSAVTTAEEKVQTSEATRRAADEAFRMAEKHGLLAILGVQGPGPAHAWTLTDALLTARSLDEATRKVDASGAAREKAWNQVSGKHQDLMRSMGPDLRVLASQVDDIMLYDAILNAQRLSLLELKAQLENDLTARDRLLADEERKLFESFLTGEAHEHLRDKLREAHALVKRIDRQLEAHPTSSGMQMRLLWEVSADAPAGTREAVGLLYRSGELLSDADRAAMQGFLKQRLDDARNRAEARSLREQLLDVLDYRAWHAFEVQCRKPGEAWSRLTKKVHGTGSGGQKAVMLHLPLFAAAAAFYDSAREEAPRFILLDEAFAGIDRQTRGELMGLLADFELDFVMTSFEEWGFYPQVDGLSTYHLAREKGMRGVYSEWFVWNGHEAVTMEA